MQLRNEKTAMAAYERPERFGRNEAEGSLTDNRSASVKQLDRPVGKRPNGRVWAAWTAGELLCSVHWVMHTGPDAQHGKKKCAPVGKGKRLGRYRDEKGGGQGEKVPLCGLRGGEAAR